MIRFTIRDLLWLTTLIAVLACWMVDRSKLLWQQEQTAATVERLRNALDGADPGWRERNDKPAPEPMSSKRLSAGGYVLGAAIFFLVVLAIVLVAKGQLHWSLLTRSRRWPQ